MLVLSRKRGEVIRVGDVEFIILDVAPGRVKVGVVAPPDMHITREAELRADKMERIFE